MPEGFNTFTYLGHDHYECIFCGECFCGEDAVWAYHECEGKIEKLYLCDNCGKIFDTNGMKQHGKESLDDNATCQCEYHLIQPFTNQEVIDAIEKARENIVECCYDCLLFNKCFVKYVEKAPNYVDFEDRLPRTYKCFWDTAMEQVKLRKEQGINITEPIQEMRQGNDGQS